MPPKDIWGYPTDHYTRDTRFAETLEDIRQIYRGGVTIELDEQQRSMAEWAHNQQRAIYEQAFGTTTTHPMITSQRVPADIILTPITEDREDEEPKLTVLKERDPPTPRHTFEEAGNRFRNIELE